MTDLATADHVERGSMSDVDDLVTWLRAQLDEDERVAKAWLPLGNPTAADRGHIARHDPARVLAEVDASRRILREYERLRLRDPMRVGPYWDGVRDAWESAVRIRAEAYADRPGYQARWRLG